MLTYLKQLNKTTQKWGIEVVYILVNSEYDRKSKFFSLSYAILAILMIKEYYRLFRKFVTLLL